jgi:hypothetical protein
MPDLGDTRRSDVPLETFDSDLAGSASGDMLLGMRAGF